MNLSLAVVALFLFALPASAQSIYEKHFYGDSSGQYVNNDVESGCSLTNNCNVSLNGSDALPILINPWESVSINVLCTKIIFIPSGPLNPTSHIYAGSNAWGSSDIMAWGVPSPTGAADINQCTPQGTSIPFPAAGAGAPINRPGQNDFTLPHIDVHIQGTPDTATYQVYLQLVYTKNAQ